MSSSEDKKLRECKVVMIGDTGVGKTHLLARYLYNTFDLNTPSTVSATFATKKVKKENGDEIVLQLWDTAGQEAYKGLTKLYFKNAYGIIIVYDITRRDSFDEIKNYWYKQAKDNTYPGIKIAIVGNKQDLYQEEKVSDEEARTYAEKIGAMFKLTSALDATGVDDLFNEMANALDDIDLSSSSSMSNYVKLDKKKKTKKDQAGCC